MGIEKTTVRVGGGARRISVDGSDAASQSRQQIFSHADLAASSPRARGSWIENLNISLEDAMRSSRQNMRSLRVLDIFTILGALICLSGPFLLSPLDGRWAVLMSFFYAWIGIEVLGFLPSVLRARRGSQRPIMHPYRECNRLLVRAVGAVILTILLRNLLDDGVFMTWFQQGFGIVLITGIFCLLFGALTSYND